MKHNRYKELNFNSIEIFESKNEAVAFFTPARTVFREDVDGALMSSPVGMYVPWGEDDYLPYDIINLVEEDETVSTCQVFNSEICYGSGLRYNTDSTTEKVKEEVDNFMVENSMPEMFLGMCQDMMYFNFAVAVIDLNPSGDRIAAVSRREACYCRFAKADDKGKINYIIYGNFRSVLKDQFYEKIPLLDKMNPWNDLLVRTGRRQNRMGVAKDSKERRFAIVLKFPGPDSTYYPIPHYASLFKGKWYDIKRLIALSKYSKLKNSAPVKYIIQVSNRYWDNYLRSCKEHDPAKQQLLVNKRKREMMTFLTTTENTGSVLFTQKSLSADGKSENPDISIVPIDKAKEGGDWESDIAEAINIICFTLRVHSNLVGSVPGKAQTNNSGSDKRELFTISHALKKPYRDILFRVHDIVCRFNGWKGVKPECPFMQLTTLDEHKDAKEVTVQ